MSWVLFNLALAPIAAVLVFIYVKDKYEREPLALLVGCFFLGILSVLPAILLETLAQKAGINVSSNTFTTFIYAFFVVGFSEEFCKFIIIRLFIFKNKNFNEPFDGIVYCVVVSMGFAAIENVMYVLQGGLGTAIMRMFTAVPAHALFGIFMGYFIGKAKFSNKKGLYLFLGLFIAIVMHGLYDFFLFQNDFVVLKFAIFPLLIAAFFISLNAIKIRVSNSPFKEDDKDNLFKLND